MIWYDGIEVLDAMPLYQDVTAPPPALTRRGGRRPGAGRRPAYSEPLLRKTVALPRSYVAQLEAFGGGNLSEGIRLLVEFAYTRDGTPWFRPIPERQLARSDTPAPTSP
jgi:hypothetical protein